MPSNAIYRWAFLNGLLSTPLVPARHRWRILRVLGMNIDPCRVSDGVWFGSTGISIGRGCYLNRDVTFDTSARITLGTEVSVGLGAAFITSTHEIGARAKRAGARKSLPIIVGDGAWVGAYARILPGVTIGAGCVIAAGAVVTRDTEADGVYAGVPARLTRAIEPAQPAPVP